jgi:hypothetical protein
LGTGAWSGSLSLQSEGRGLVRVGRWRGTLCGRVVLEAHDGVSWGLRGLRFLCRGPYRRCILLVVPFSKEIGRCTSAALERVVETGMRVNSVGLLGLGS